VSEVRIILVQRNFVTSGIKDLVKGQRSLEKSPSGKGHGNPSIPKSTCFPTVNSQVRKGISTISFPTRPLYFRSMIIRKLVLSVFFPCTLSCDQGVRSKPPVTST
jgi:hypothetical protein